MTGPLLSPLRPPPPDKDLPDKDLTVDLDRVTADPTPHPAPGPPANHP
ncbi:MULTISPECIES: hypothetical protein [unclassified Streptomyces]